MNLITSSFRQTQFFLLLFAMAIGCARSSSYDLAIRHGRIIDGAGNNWFYGDIAIKDGRIVKIGYVPESAAKEIDATNLIVAPGFIDVHTHADTDLYTSPQAENFIRDGVTTIVTGNCGLGVTDVGKYFDHLQSKPPAINVATLIGHNAILREVKGNVAGDLSAAQMARAKSMVRKAMIDGAMGMSTGLIYTPGEWSKPEEIIELQKVVAEYHGIYTSHMRSESTGIMAAIDEALRVGREAGTRVEISHFKLPADVALKIGGSDATLKKVLDARLAGQEVWLDQYPYTASNTSLSTMLPDWVLENGPAKAKELLRDPKELSRVLAEMKHNNEVSRGRKDMSYAVVGSCKAYKEYEGKSILVIAQLRKFHHDNPKSVELLGATPPQLPAVTMEEQYRTIIDIYLAGPASCVFHTMNETEVENILHCPLVSIASDSGVREFGVGVPHPRGYGTNARVLGHYVRDRHVISLEEAIRKMTSMPADAFRLKDRGLLRPGAWADITIFDPQTVTDRAAYEKPHQYATGIPFVIVNGQLVIENDKLTLARPGRPIRANDQ